MTFLYEPARIAPPVPACAGRCLRCINDALEASNMGGYWWGLWAARVPTCRVCHRHEGCPGADSCARQCTTDPADIEPPNRRNTIILPAPDMTPPPPNR